MMLTLLLSLALKSAIVLALGALGALMLRDAPAAARHGVWAGTFAVLLLLPVLLLAGPAWQVAVLPDAPKTSSVQATIRPVAPVRVEAPATEVRSAAAAVIAQAPPDMLARTSPAPRPSFVATMPVWGWIAMIWALGALAIGGVWFRAFALARRLVRNADLVTDPRLMTLGVRASQKTGMERPVRILRSDDLGVPIAWGFGRRAVVLPPTADDWDAGRCEAVLLHEMAHLARRDAWTQLVAQIALALYWPNPLTWLAYRRFMDAREQACDDTVLRVGATPTGYASHLVAVARELSPSRLTLAAVAPMGARGELENRVRSLLDVNRRRSPLGRAALLATVGISMAIGIPLAAFQPVRAGVGAVFTSSRGPVAVARLQQGEDAVLSAEDTAVADTIPPPEVVEEALHEAARSALRSLRERQATYTSADDEEWQQLENRVLNGISADVSDHETLARSGGSWVSGMGQLPDLEAIINGAMNSASPAFRQAARAGNGRAYSEAMAVASSEFGREMQAASVEFARAKREYERAMESRTHSQVEVARYEASLERAADLFERQADRSSVRFEHAAEALQRDMEQVERDADRASDAAERAAEARERQLERAQGQRERQQEQLERQQEQLERDQERRRESRQRTRNQSSQAGSGEGASVSHTRTAVRVTPGSGPSYSLTTSASAPRATPTPPRPEARPVASKKAEPPCEPA